MNWQEVNIG